MLNMLVFLRLSSPTLSSSLLPSAHMAFGSLALLPLMLVSSKYKGEHTANVTRNWRALCFIGLVNGPQIALNNASLVSIELSLNQAHRSFLSASYLSVRART